MSNYTFSAELLDDALFRSDEETNGQSDYEAASLQYLNRVYQALWTGGAEFVPGLNEVWWWLQTEANAVLQPKVTTGTVAVTKLSNGVTFTTAPTPLVDANVTGWFLSIAGFPDVFKIASHTTASTSATLDSAYTGSTAAAASFKLFKLDYTIPTAAMSVLTPMTAQQDNTVEITGMLPARFKHDYPLSLIEERIPYRFAHLNETTIRFNAFPTDLARVDYFFIARPADLTDSVTEEPLVPRQYRRVLSLMASFYIMQDKNDPRRQEVAVEAQALVKQMVQENRARSARSGKEGWIFPRRRGGGRKGPLRTESGHIIG